MSERVSAAEAKREVREGQIWREVDPRKERFVRVVSVNRSGVYINVELCTVMKVGRGTVMEPFRWVAVHGARVTRAVLSRFDGRRGGYALVEEG